ncbi:jerky protein homolog-like [Hylaeus anthracinus]|uniref:jerky protein homolog-like n=1 Tax=Hylaeus anthracinus TaxID=313031 RepID=UPI0023B9035E|nr:jerky protein homolog-like [Hylaeus anthracinus]
MASSSAGKIQQITYEKRLEILQKLEEGVSPDKLAAEYGLHKRTIQKYRKNATSIRQFSDCTSCLHSKRIRPVLHGIVDSRLYTWVMERRALGDVLTNNLLQKKAMELHIEFGGPSNFVASNGWLECFKRRHNLRLGGVYREWVGVNAFAPEKFPEELNRILTDEDIFEDDVYVMDVMSLMWKALPQRLLLHEGEQWVNSRKIKKDCITVALCANTTGAHKLPILFVHKYANPRALKHCMQLLPVVYKNEPNSWITEPIFNDWYTNYFKQSVKEYQVQQNRVGKVLLLVNNSKGLILSEEALEDCQFKQMFLPSNTTSRMQPMDQSIITKCKKLFRHKLLCRVLQHDIGVQQFYLDYDIKDCIDMIAEAWDMITATTIQNLWRHILCRSSLDNTSERQDSNDCVPEDMQQFGEIINENDITEWISECEKEESIVIKEDNTDSQHSEIESEIDYIFHGLAIWAETKPEFIKLNANILIDYFKQK